MTIPFTDPWRAQVTRLFVQEGLGVEDIAVRLGCAADQVRREMDDREVSGTLTNMIRLQRVLWMKQAREKWGCRKLTHTSH